MFALLIASLAGLGLGGAVSPSLPLFTRTDISIREAPAENRLQLLRNPNPRLIKANAGKALRARRHNAPVATETANTVFSGVYPCVNLTWGSKTPGEPGQQIISYIDTGSSDTWAVSSQFTCADIATKTPQLQSYCNFGNYFDPTVGVFDNITNSTLNLEYFPEGDVLQGSMGIASITVAGLTVPDAEVALITYAAWDNGDGASAGLLGLGYPALTSASAGHYDPIFTKMVKQGIVTDAVFTLAVDREEIGYSPLAPAGQMAIGGLVDASYYEGSFTSVPMNTTAGFYTITHSLVYGVTSRTRPLTSGGTFLSIVDSSTGPNFVPTPSANAINALFDPPAVYNATLDYYVAPCNASVPYVAYVIGGVEMPMDPRDMLVRNLVAIEGYDDVCFSAFGDGGDATVEDALFLIGVVWQHAYVVAYDQGNSMLHFAKRTPY
ncbi:aspartic peptidase domain-containing protein [Mycena galopus ATCC 62051]|nr:aspartic peptidase domain-containing protein [Mycena galopus ATCC 62051]